jgi:3-oxoacyl-[acyl-carrier protein] reductase
MKDGKLNGKVAVVTGASKGIGASIAKHLAAEGAAVIVNYSSSKTDADKVVAEIVDKGGKAVAVQANVAKKADVDRLFAESKKAFGALDILVNNAGVYEFVPLEDVTEEHFHRQFNVNVLGLILATQEAVKQFGPAGGSIVNISSLASSAAPPTGSVYSATKAAVDAVTKSLAKELVRARSASTPSTLAWWRQKVFMQRELPRAISANRSRRKLRWDGSGSRRTLLRSQCSSLPRIRVG